MVSATLYHIRRCILCCLRDDIGGAIHVLTIGWTLDLGVEV